MASKLCCTTEQEVRANSPDLPNARLSDATPARRPLLPKDTSSPSSQFTSARSEELHELRLIFDNAKDDESKQSSPTKTPRSRFARPSVHSLHNLPKIKSVQALIRRKLSKDLGKTSITKDGGKKQVVHDEADTVVMTPRDGPNRQLKITKDDLRKDLLSDKKPDQGGYDSDAEVMDDIAKNMLKRSSSKRPSLRSIDWAPSPSGSKTTPELTENHRIPDYGLYDIGERTSTRTPLFNRFAQITSAPDLRFEPSKTTERKVRRSHSASSIELPRPSPFSAIRLPSLSATGDDDVPWATDTVQSLQLSQISIPSNCPASTPSKPPFPVNEKVILDTSERGIRNLSHTKSPLIRSSSATAPLQIRVQEPTSLRTSTSIKEHNDPSEVEDEKKSDDPKNQDGDRESEHDRDARRSVHLYSMRISHHLRSGSLLSWDNLADAPELPSPPRMFRDRAISNASKLSIVQNAEGHSRHERQSSSSGFASSKVPSRWGKVRDAKEGKSEMSSIYSSRPQSPPDSLGGSLGNLSQYITQQTDSKNASRRHSDSHAADDDETPKPVKIRKLKSSRTPSGANNVSKTSQEAPRLARNNSVADTKRSKFREEFSPSPPRKKASASESIMKFLRPRSSVRSRSDTSLNAIPKVDGPFEKPDASDKRDRRVSRSLMSLQAEQKALGNDKSHDPMWDRALKTYQNERSAMFLTPNKALATQGSPLRERSGSMLRSKSISSHTPSTEPSPNASLKRFSAPPVSTSPSTPDERHTDPPPLRTRRTALFAAEEDDIDPAVEVQHAFHKQTDSKEVVGAWGRYPSHNREDRTASATHLDKVRARDFAHEAPLQLAMGNDVESEVDPGDRPESLQGGKKKKKKFGSERLARSNSVTFGKQFLKNYTKIFKSQSTEFQRHGSGHRSSIATSGMLEYPELEIIPDVWRHEIIEEKNHAGETHHNSGHGYDGAGPSGYRSEDSMATLRPPRTTQSLDGAVGSDSPSDRARIWSVYYEGLLPGFPRGSLDLGSLADFGATPGLGSARHSFDSKVDRALHHSRAPSMLSRTLPTRLNAKHSRGWSRVSMKSGTSAVPSFTSMGGEDDDGEGKSIVSVRRSTMDLIGLYKEQEMRERERVLGMLRDSSFMGGRERDRAGSRIMGGL